MVINDAQRELAKIADTLDKVVAYLEAVNEANAKAHLNGTVHYWPLTTEARDALAAARKLAAEMHGIEVLEELRKSLQETHEYKKTQGLDQQGPES